MWLKQTYFVLFLLQVTSIASQLTIDQKCKTSDSTCMVRTAQKLIPYFTAGIPELDIPSLDVMSIDKMKIEFSGLHLTLKDVKVSGLKNTVVEDIKWDMQKKTIHVKYRLASNFVRGKYQASGNFLILPISGDGDVTMELKNYYVNLHMPFEIETKNGKSFIKLVSHDFEMGVDGFLNIQFTNLFNGNKALSDALHKFMNENWKEVVSTFGKATFSKPVSKLYKAIKKYLNSQPMENFVINN